MDSNNSFPGVKVAFTTLWPQARLTWTPRNTRLCIAGKCHYLYDMRVILRLIEACQKAKIYWVLIPLCDFRWAIVCILTLIVGRT